MLQTLANDTEDAPWMVMASLQVRDVDLLKAILLLHARRQGLPWVIESYLLITMSRPVGTGTLEAAPDLLVTPGEDRQRTSWNVVSEGRAPAFALEVVTDSSWERDSADKPLIYAAMGVAEFALFYPLRHDGGPALFGYRRGADGGYVAWPADAAGRLRSERLGLHLGIADQLWLRAWDRDGRLLPSPTELAKAEAAAREEAEQRAVSESTARAAAEAEVARLREELRRLREGPP